MSDDTCTVKLLLVDDHKVLRLGLKALFETVPSVCVVGEAGTVAEAIAEVRRCPPDVVLMDIRLADGSGVEALRKIRSLCPSARVLMLTSYSDEAAVVDSIAAGAVGYLLKQTDPERLIEAVELVARGGSLLDPEITSTVLARIQHRELGREDDPLAVLSEQERRILPLIIEGKTNREIAATLTLSENTIKTYVSNILQKLHLSRRGEAATFMTRHHM